MYTYMGHSEQKTAPKSEKIQKNGPKMAFFKKCVIKWMVLAIIYCIPWAMGATVQKGT